MRFLHFIADQPFTESAVAFTGSVAKMMNASVTLLYVSERNQDLNAGWLALETASEALKGLDIKVKLEQGDPIEKLLAVLDEEEYDIVMMGMRRRKRFFRSRKRLLSNQVLKHSPVPVMMVRGESFKLEKILVCTGGQDISNPVVETSASLAKAAGVETTLLYVAGSVPSMYTGFDEMEETLEEVLVTDTPLSQHLKHGAETLLKTEMESHVEIRHGPVVEVILTEAQKGGYDLIVLGASSPAFADLMMSKVTQQIINRAQSAVLVVK